MQLVRRLRSTLAIAALSTFFRNWRKGRRRVLLTWIGAEAVWYIFMRWVLIPSRIQALRVTDAGECAPGDFHRTVDMVVRAVKRDGRTFWKRITRIASADRIPVDTVKNYARSLLYVNPDKDLTASKAELIDHATERLEVASGRKFSVEDNCDYLPNVPKSRQSPQIKTTISGWVDDNDLQRIVRTTPLVVCVAAECSVAFTSGILRLAGWYRASTHKCGLQAWIWKPKCNSLERPLVLIPGSVIGYLSFLPFALHLQQRLPSRMIVLFRCPWSEVGMPFERMPQWNPIVEGVLAALSQLNIKEWDMVSHSYGTCISNRVLRRLCGLDADEGFPSSGFGRCGTLILLEPMIFGDTSAGFSCGLANSLGPDINIASLSNRGGVPWKETMFYDPAKRDQCLDGIVIYACSGDGLLNVSMLTDVCQKYVPSAKLELDNTWMSFHGRCFTEMFLGGVLWGAPCASRCLNTVLNAIKDNEVNNEVMNSKCN